jgi:hypothetical protein
MTPAIRKFVARAAVCVLSTLTLAIFLAADAPRAQNAPHGGTSAALTGRALRTAP